MHDAHILKFWMIIIVIDLKTAACFQCRLHTFAFCNVQFNSGPSAIKKWGNYKEIETWLDEQNNPHLLLMNFMSFKSHQNRKRFGQFKAKIRSLTSRNIIQLQWHQSGKFFRLRAVFKVRSQEKNRQLVVTVINNGKINLVCNTNLLQTLYKTFYR